MKEVRPTSGRVLSALFSILGDISGIRFLDMFAGTGRVGLEAMSRGAECVFVEGVRERAESIRKSAGDSVVLALDVRRAVSWLVKREHKFGVIFADPPYNSGWSEALPALHDLEKLFDDDCIFIVEHSVREEINPGKFAITSQRDYGETRLTFMEAVKVDKQTQG